MSDDLQRHNGVEEDPLGAFVYHDAAMRRIGALKRELDESRKKCDDLRRQRDQAIVETYAASEQHEGRRKDVLSLQADLEVADQTILQLTERVRDLEQELANQEQPRP
jgi:chromosome segregation ATPase